MNDPPRIRTLVVEDSPTDALLLKEALTDVSYAEFAITHVERLQDALRCLDETEFDAVLLDLGLPDSQGLDTLVRLRGQQPEVPVVVLTGLDDEAAGIRALQAGAQDYVVKAHLQASLLGRSLRYAIERHHAALELRQSEARLAAIIGSAMDGIITLDERLRITAFNPSAEKMFACRAADVLGRRVEQFIPDVFDSAERLGISGQPNIALQSMSGSAEIFARRADGAQFSIEASVARMEVANEIQFTVVVHEISERKEADALRTRLAAIVESSDDAIVGKSLEGVITSWNRGAEQLYGYAAEEALGKHISIVVPEERQHETEEMLLSIRRGGSVDHLETVRVRKDGTRVAVSLIISPIRDSRRRVVGASSIARDITERQRAEERLRESEEQFRTLANAIPQLCWMANADGRIFWFNQRSYDYTGTTPKDLESWAWQSALDPEVAPKVLESWKASIATGKPFEMIFSLRGVDGLFRPFLTRVMPLCDPEGNVLRWFGTNTDVSEQQNIQEALRRRAEELEKVMTVAPVGIWVAHDPACHVITGNLTANQMLEAREGENVSADRWPGKSASRWRVFRDGRELVAGELPLRAAARGEEVKGVEWDVLLPSGRHISLFGHASPLQDAAGQVRGCVGAFVDITERKRVEAENLRLITSMEQCAETIIITDPKGTVEYVNPKFCEVSGYSREEAIGSNPRLLKSGKHAREFFKEFWETIRAGKTWHGEIINRRKDGTLYTDDLHVAPVRDADGNITHFISNQLDITERKRAQEAQNASETRYRRLFEAAQDGVVLLDSETGAITDVNPSLLRLLGYTPEEVVGRKLWEIGAFPDVLRSQDAFRRLQDAGFLRYEDLPLETKSGERREVEFVSNIYEAGGKKVIQCNIRDISERVQAQKEIRVLNQELETRVQTRTAELEAANTELEAFNSSVAHDLRSPVRHMAGFAQILAEEHGKELGPDARECLEKIRNGSIRMGKLVDDLLELARVGRRTVNWQRTNLEELAAEVVVELEAETQGRQIEWRIGQLPLVVCDRVLLKQAFYNLLSNAVKYTRPRNPAVIEVGSCENSGANSIYVRDNGVGFNMAHAGKLFGIFQRLHREEEFEGTGVGLAVVQRVIHRHGGRVWAEAEPGRGASFYFTLRQPSEE